MPSTSSEPARRRPLARPGRRFWQLASLVCGAAACTYAPGPAHPCPALPANALPHAEAPLPAVELRDFAAHDGGVAHGTLVGGGECVRFTLRERPAVDAVRPLVLVVPILAGGEELIDQIASRLLDRGFDVVTCARAGQALRAPQRGADLDTLFARTVLHQRLVLHWLRERDRERSEIARSFHVLGISLGGMVTTVVAALERDLVGVAVCLSGGDLAGLVPISSEGRVQSWRRWRNEADGVGDDHLRQELGAAFAHEPLRFAPSVPTDRVLLVTAAFDTVVPVRNQDLLWEAFGRPARLQVPLGHYSAALLLDGIVTAVANHFVARTIACGAPGAASGAAPGGGADRGLGRL